MRVLCRVPQDGHEREAEHVKFVKITKRDDRAAGRLNNHPIRESVPAEILSRAFTMLKITRTVAPDTGAVTIALSGSADIHAVDQLTTAVSAAAAGHPKDLTIDLGELTFICSLGIGQLVVLQRSIRAKGGVMRLVHVQPAIYQCLHHARLNEVFTIVGP
jgi:anti-anti-sigma factor